MFFDVPAASLGSRMSLKAPREFGMGRFRFTMVADPHLAEKIAAHLRAVDPDVRWPIEEWLADAATSRMFGLAIHVPRKPEPSGFIVCDRRPAIVIRESGSLCLEYEFAAEYLYLSPDVRGLGLSSVLRRIAMDDVSDDMARLSAVVADWRANGEAVGFDVAVEGDAQSPEGRRFLKAVHREILQHAEEAGLQVGSGGDPTDGPGHGGHAPAGTFRRR